MRRSSRRRKPLTKRMALRMVMVMMIMMVTVPILLTCVVIMMVMVMAMIMLMMTIVVVVVVVNTNDCSNKSKDNSVTTATHPMISAMFEHEKKFRRPSRTVALWPSWSRWLLRHTE